MWLKKRCCTELPRVAGKHFRCGLHWKESCSGSAWRNVSHRCSQKWLAVVNLDQPEEYSEPKAVRKLGRQNKYEIKAVLWNPHLVKEDLLASTCQQKLEVWNVNAERHPLVHSLKAHTRPVRI
ncbi:GATOR2 complex protein WDR59-like [Halichondria panicea]|uniref:GATOR2 complex protein WDR59-like n=1 Tax=Halichondria panicea TaxID=6063 RepID=UPI00312B2D07